MKEIIDPLYPADNLYPADDLFPRDPNTISMTGHYITFDYEDFQSKEITQIEIRPADDSAGAIVGTSGNNYVISGNFLVSDKSGAELSQIAANTLSIIRKASYTPLISSEVVGNPCIELGDPIRFNTTREIVESYVLQRTLTGIQNKRDSIVSSGTETHDKNPNGIIEKISSVQRRTNKLERTADHTLSELADLDANTSSRFEQTAEQTAATGGKGNAQLIIWDYGKEITLTLQDALYSPASMSAMLGSYEGNDFTKGVKETKRIDRTEKCVAKRSFIVPAGNSKGVPSEGENTAQAVYIDLNTMQPYQDGAPIAEGEVYLKWTRSVAYGDNSLGNTIEISAEKFPGTYKVVGDTYARSKATGEDQRFQFVIPQAKMSSEQTITLEAEGDPTVFDMTLTVLRPDDGVMVKLIQYDVVENEEENDGSTMVKDTENLNLLDDAEMFKVSAEGDDDNEAIGATEY